MDEICSLLNRLIKIYQIPNCDNETVMFLAEWIMDQYKHHDFALIQESLRNPPRNDFNTWRLTPDTISIWIEQTQNKRANKAIVEESRMRQDAETPKHQYSPETEKMIQEYINSLSGFKEVQALTDDDVKKYGQEKPVKKSASAGYVAPDREYVVMKELRRRYHLEYFDKVTGKALPGAVSFEEYLLL